MAKVLNMGWSLASSVGSFLFGKGTTNVHGEAPVNANVHVDGANVQAFGDNALSNAADTETARQVANTVDREAQLGGEALRRNANNLTDAVIRNGETLADAGAGATELVGQGALVAATGGAVGVAAAGAGALVGGIGTGVGNVLRGEGERRLLTARGDNLAVQGEVAMEAGRTRNQVVINQDQRAAEREAIPLAAERAAQHYRELHFEQFVGEAEEKAAHTRVKKGLQLLWNEIGETVGHGARTKRCRIMVKFVVTGDDIRLQLARLLYGETGFLAQARQKWPNTQIGPDPNERHEAVLRIIYPHGDLETAMQDATNRSWTMSGSRDYFYNVTYALLSLGVNQERIEIFLGDAMTVEEKAEILGQTGAWLRGQDHARPVGEYHLIMVLDPGTAASPESLDQPKIFPLASTLTHLPCEGLNDGRFDIRGECTLAPPIRVLGLEEDGRPLAAVNADGLARYTVVASDSPLLSNTNTLEPLEIWRGDNPLRKRIVIDRWKGLRGVGVKGAGGEITDWKGKPYKSGRAAAAPTPPTPAPPYQALPAVATQ